MKPKERPARCSNCFHEFEATDNDKVNGRLPCPKCDANSYWDHVKEQNYVPVLNIRSKETRKQGHAGVKS
jgi:predicted  nucleic acid-binding Zn-ribbon protein